MCGDLDQIDVVEMAIASKHDEQWIAKKSHIPAVIKDVVVVRAAGPAKATAPSKTVFEIADTLTQPILTAAPAAVHHWISTLKTVVCPRFSP